MENVDKAKRKTAPKNSAEVREPAVRMVFEHRSEYATQWEAIKSIVAKMGCSRYEVILTSSLCSICACGGNNNPCCTLSTAFNGGRPGVLYG